MKRINIIIISLLLTPLSFADTGSDDLIDILVIAKSTGMCGTFKQLSAFQESTKMPGGDEFILRFLNTESARLGKTLPELLKQCQTSVKMYNDIMAGLKKP